MIAAVRTVKQDEAGLEAERPLLGIIARSHRAVAPKHVLAA
jgi:hypothetical protein